MLWIFPYFPRKNVEKTMYIIHPGKILDCVPLYLGKNIGNVKLWSMGIEPIRNSSLQYLKSNF